MNDSELVQGLRRRDPAAKQWLCDCYLPSLWRFVYVRVHGDQHLAEDIINETVLAMLTAVETSAVAEIEIVNPAGWLRTVAVRRITDHFRAVARVQQCMPRLAKPEGGSVADDPAEHQQLQETRAQVRRAMDSLPEQYRLVLEWKYLDKLSVREISQRWSMSEKAAESILFRARREFRDQIAGPAESSTDPRSAKKRESLPEESPEQSPAHKS